MRQKYRDLLLKRLGEAAFRYLKSAKANERREKMGRDRDDVTEMVNYGEMDEAWRQVALHDAEQAKARPCCSPPAPLGSESAGRE